MTNINIDALPDSVLVEILCRLPCNKLVFQCSCVYKRWYTLISNPYFIGRFLQLQVNKRTPIKGTLINPKGEDISTRMSSPVFKTLMTVHGLKQEPVVVGTYNDLVLCCARESNQRDYYISNHYCSYKEDDRNGYFIQVNAEYKCKVVRILPPDLSADNENYDSFKLKVEIFSFETGEWRQSVVSSPVTHTWLNYKIIFAYNGMLYWPDEDRRGRLVGLDPFAINNIISSSTSSSNGDDVTDSYKCRLVKLNDPALAEDDTVISTVASLGVCGGCVRMCDMKYWFANTLSVYDLKEERDGHDKMVVDGAGKFCLKHTRVYSLDPNMFLHHEDLVVEMLAFDPTNEDILYLNIDGDVVMCNICTREWSEYLQGRANLILMVFLLINAPTVADTSS